MAKQKIIQNSFNAGEVSPIFEGRGDFVKYKNALKTLENFIPLVTGGVKRRAGSRWVAEVLDSSKATRLIPFEFNDEQAYIIEFGNTYIRFYREGGRIEAAAKTITGAANNGSGLIRITASSHGYSTNDYVDIAGVVGTTEANGDWKITVISSSTFDLVGSTFSNAYGSAGTAREIIQVTTPWLEAELFDLQFTQSADVMWVVHRNHKPRKITRSSHVAWTLANYAPTSDPWTSSNNYPGAIGFYEQRLVLASTNTDPQTLWFSVSGNFDSHALGSAAADDAIKVTVASGQVNVIQWLAKSRELAVGTIGGELEMSGGGSNDPITPTNRKSKDVGGRGSARVQPVKSGNVLLFLQRAGRKLRELRFDLDADGFTSEDLTVLAEHITDGGVTQIAAQQEPDPIVWCVRGDGVLLSLTYEKEQDVVAWARHIFGGVFSTGSAVCESVAVIPHPDIDRDQVWVVVKRTINSVTRRYVELLENKMSLSDHYPDMQVDSGLTYSGSAVSTLSGLGHLEGQTVSVVANGAVRPSVAVSGGAIAGLDPTVTQAEVGLPFESTLETLRPEISGLGTIQNLRQSYNRIWVRFYQTLGAEINGQQKTFRKAGDPTDSPPSVQDVDLRTMETKWDREGRITVKQTQPLPMTILFVAGDLNVGD
jgi:hypothetical protein